NLIRKIMLLLLLGCLSQYSFSINPVDPPVKTGEDVKTTTLQQAASQRTAPQEECSELFSIVNVTVNINITDCPNYTCEAKRNCTFHIYLYQGGIYLGRVAFDPTVCYYPINVRPDDAGGQITIIFVADPPGCSNSYNNSPVYYSVPEGGGTINADITFCE
ncbi:MAG: hypothetical protein WCL00_14655, partial [Bacteroidota bacterium]